MKGYDLPPSKNVLPAPYRPKPQPPTQQALNINANITNMPTTRRLESVLADVEKIISEYKKRNADTVITVNISLNY